jgi:hypothetical protein
VGNNPMTRFDADGHGIHSCTGKQQGAGECHAGEISDQETAKKPAKKQNQPQPAPKQPSPTPTPNPTPAPKQPAQTPNPTPQPVPPAVLGVLAPRGNPQFNAGQGAVNLPGPETPAPTLKPLELPTEEVVKSPLQQAVEILQGVLEGLGDKFVDIFPPMYIPPSIIRKNGGCPTPDCTI